MDPSLAAFTRHVFSLTASISNPIDSFLLTPTQLSIHVCQSDRPDFELNVVSIIRPFTFQSGRSLFYSLLFTFEDVLTRKLM